MLISKRRLKWGFGLLLAAGAIAFVRPARTGLDVALARHLDADLRVKQVSLHHAQSVVEIRDIFWSKTADQRVFGLKADRAWLAVDGAELWDGKIVIPTGEVEEALLFFSNYTPQDDRPDEIWDTELNSHLAKVDWAALREKYMMPLAPAEVTGAIRKSIDQWLAASHEIKEEVDGISRVFQSENNPLRYAEELRSKIKQIDELASRHDEIISRFQALPVEVENRTASLKIEMSDHVRRLATDLFSGEDLRRSKTRIAESMMLQIARGNWTRLSDCAQIAQLVATNMPYRPRPEYDRDIPISGDSEFLSIHRLRVAGLFVHQKTRTPFTLTTDITLGNQDENPVNSVWNYRFSDADVLIGVRVEQTGKPDQVNLELRVLEDLCDVSPSDLPAADSDEPDDSWKDRSDYLARFLSHSREGVLRGELEVVARSFAGQPEQYRKVLQKALFNTAQSKLSYHVDVEGTWQEPELALRDDLPDWLVAAIDSTMNEQLAEVNSEADSQLRDEVSQEIARLQSLVQIATDNGQAIAQVHRQQIETTRNELLQRLNDLTEKTFSVRLYDRTLAR